MLIDSHRLTVRDRQFWLHCESADLINSLPHVSLSVAAITQFASQPCWCAVSWGKDSVCVAELVATSAPHVPMRWVVTHRVNPDCYKVRDAFLSRHRQIDYDEIIEPSTPWPHWGYGLTLAPFKRSIHGVRSSESSERKISAMVHGLQTKNMCRPILHWTTDEVFAFIAQNQLPLHPAYAMTGGGRWPRDRLRVGTLGGERGGGIGRAEWEQEYYGDVLNRLAAGR